MAGGAAVSGGGGEGYAKLLDPSKTWYNNKRCVCILARGVVGSKTLLQNHCPERLDIPMACAMPALAKSILTYAMQPFDVVVQWLRWQYDERAADYGYLEGLL